VLKDYREVLDRLADGCAWSDAEPVARAVELAEEETDRNEAANGERRTANGQTPVDAEWLADLVADVLELPEVDTDTSLLSLGATSLDMLRVAARLEHATGESVELEELVTAASLSALPRRPPPRGAGNARRRVGRPCRGGARARARRGHGGLRPLDGCARGIRDRARAPARRAPPAGPPVSLGTVGAAPAAGAARAARPA